MVTCGISDSFESLSPTSGQVTYVLLSRSPLAFPLAGIGSSDLHVLCTPPAFVLSQDQTLRQKIRPPFRAVHLSFEFDQKINETAWRSCHSSAVKDRAPTSQWNSAYGRDADVHDTHHRAPASIGGRRRRSGAARRPSLPHRAATVVAVVPIRSETYIYGATKPARSMYWGRVTWPEGQR